MNKYNDIINLTRPISNHPKMPIESRASIFSPFAALSGYEESIIEEGRLTINKKVLDIDRIEEINNKLKNIEINKTYKVIYYRNDNYIEEIITIKKIDIYDRYIITTSNNKINIDDIYEIII